jgi:hypothetical protein
MPREDSWPQVENVSEDAATPLGSGTHLKLAPFLLGSSTGEDTLNEPRGDLGENLFPAGIGEGFV